jgi:cytochrome c oxidase subunit I
VEQGRFSTPALWIYGAIFVGIAGLVTGRLLESAQPADTSLQDGYYIAAHYRYPAWMTALFLVFAAVYFFFPRLTGYRYNTALGKLHFWTTFVGIDIAALPMHFLSLRGMPRRYADYPHAFAGWSRVSSIGAFIAGLGFVIFLIALVEAFVRRRPARGDAPP